MIGVTGGIGAGKSTAIEQFVKLGAVPFSADAAVHALYASGEVRDELVERWGARVLAPGDSVDRAAVATIVFADEAERRWLEGLIHPLVARDWLRFVDEQRRRDPAPEFIVAEVPLLFEAGLEDRYDAVVAVTAPLETRLVRVGERAGGQLHGAERASVQMPEAEKVARADFSYANTGSIDDLGSWAQQVLGALRERVSP